MINNTGQRLLVITEECGEVLFKINQNEKITIRSELQQQNDKIYAQMVNFKKGRFIKVMIEEKEVVDKLKDFPATYLALNIMKRYIVYNYNVLMKNNKKYKIVDLAEDMGISRQMASRHIQRLKELNIIQEVETANKGKLFAINPNYYFAGTQLPQPIVDAFIVDFKN